MIEETESKMIYARAIGGPGHGKFLLGRQGKDLHYATAWAGQGYYRPSMVKLPGWRIKLPVWIHETMWRAGDPLVPAYYMPGYAPGPREVCMLPLTVSRGFNGPVKVQW